METHEAPRATRENLSTAAPTTGEAIQEILEYFEDQVSKDFRPIIFELWMTQGLTGAGWLCQIRAGNHAVPKTVNWNYQASPEAAIEGLLTKVRSGQLGV